MTRRNAGEMLHECLRKKKNQYYLLVETFATDDSFHLEKELKEMPRGALIIYHLGRGGWRIFGGIIRNLG